MSQQQHIKAFERAAQRVAFKRQIVALLGQLSVTEQLEFLYELTAERAALAGQDAVGIPVAETPVVASSIAPGGQSSESSNAEDGDSDDASDGDTDDDASPIIDLIAAMVAGAPRGLTVPEACEAMASRHPDLKTSKQYVNIALKRLEARGLLKSRPNQSNRPGRKIYSARANGGADK